MEKEQVLPPPNRHSYSLRRSTLHAKENLKEIDSDHFSVSHADSSFSSKAKRHHGKKIKKSKKNPRYAELSESEDEIETEEQGIEPSPLDLILLNKLPTSQKDLKTFKLEIDKHIQKYRSTFFQEIQNNKGNVTRSQKRSTRALCSFIC